MTDTKDRTTPADAAQKFDYGRHFGTMRTLGELVRTPGPRAWTTSMPREPEAHRFVVWLGCNIVRTAHIAETLSDVLTHLGVDFVALGGPSHCCGIVHRTHGDAPVGDAMLTQTMRKFDAFAPERLLNWCPSCDGTLHATAPADLTPTARDRISVTTFLAGLDEHFTFRPVEPVRVAIHAHTGFVEQDADTAAARALLTRIPGLDIVDVPPIADYGRHCSDANIARHGTPAYLRAVEEWIGAARRGGADEIVSIYHSCHRQILLAQADFAPQARMPVTNYLTHLARSLGLSERIDTFGHFARQGGAAAIIGEIGPGLAARGIDAARVRTALEDQFG